MTADGTIVVGVDGSDGADRAIEWAMAEAAIHGSKVVLVHVWRFPDVAVTRYAGDPLPVFGRDDIELRGKQLLAEVARSAAKLDGTVNLETRLVQGHPAAVLVDASRQARLLVVGSRGLGGFTGMLMGSVSAWCAHHAHCPVVIVRPGD